MARVLVVVPTFDHQDTLEPALTSALRQTFRDFELVVMGDGAPAASRAIVEALGARDPRIRGVWHPKAACRGEALRDLAVRASASPLVAYLGDDDLWLPHHLETLVGALERADFAHTAQVEVEVDGSAWCRIAHLASPRLRALIATRASNFFGPSCAGHRREAYLGLPLGWDPAPEGCPSDMHMWAKFLAAPGIRCLSLLEPTALHFPAGERGADAPAARAAELAGWLARMGESGFAKRLRENLFVEPGELVGTLQGERPADLAQLFALHRMVLVPETGPPVAAAPDEPVPVRLTADQGRLVALRLAEHVQALTAGSAQLAWEAELAARPACTGSRLALAANLARQRRWAELQDLVATATPGSVPCAQVLRWAEALAGRREFSAAAAVLAARMVRSPGERLLAAAKAAAERAALEEHPAGLGPPPPVQGRAFRSALAPGLRERIDVAKARTTYRGLAFYKDPFDVVLYLQLLGRLRPRTVIELGTLAGGSALWFADMLSSHGIEAPRVVTVDRKPSGLPADPRITPVIGELADLATLLPRDLLEGLARPWLVIDDASHEYLATSAALLFFDRHLRRGDYLVVEDGLIDELANPAARRKGGGPNRAVAELLAILPARYRIDAGLCDFYGPNVTWSPNGWLERL